MEAARGEGNDRQRLQDAEMKTEMTRAHARLQAGIITACRANRCEQRATGGTKDVSQTGVTLAGDTDGVRWKRGVE